MYHYKESGLPNVRLANGYKEIETPYGPAVSIENLTGLHKAIGIRIIESTSALTGPEVRFLRKELDLSQKALGDWLGVSEQTVAQWEKKGTIQPPEDRLLRALYREYITGNAEVEKLVKLLAKKTKPTNVEESWNFEETEQGWTPKAA